MSTKPDNPSELPCLAARTHSLSPMRAEVRVDSPWPIDPDAEIRGRLMGPRCRFASTIEVAYPFRTVDSSLVLSAIIPEPSLWDSAHPFLYEGPLEYWLNGTLRERAWVRHCLRTLKFGPRASTLNGKPITIHSIELPAESMADSELIELRSQGVNALLTADPNPQLREQADRLGFLLLPPTLTA